MLKLLLNEVLQPLVFPLYCVSFWTLVGLLLWSIWKATRDGVARLRRMHQIPCDRCVFFTNNHHLKCTVHPSKAMSEEAIGCRDFQPHEDATSTPKRCSQTSARSRIPDKRTKNKFPFFTS